MNSLTWLASVLVALGVGGGAGWLLAYMRAQTAVASAATDSAARVAAEQRARALFERNEQVVREQEITRTALNDAREAVGAAEAGAARVPQLEAELTRLRNESAEAIARAAELAATLNGERASNVEKLALLTHAREQLSQEFKVLAADIFADKQRTFAEQSKQSLDHLLQPLGERLQSFEKTVQESHGRDTRDRMSLGLEIRKLSELNQRLNVDAVNLTRALTGASNKTQGNWGEMILESVLEKSGLVKGREYQVQVSDERETEDGGRRRYQPDVVIHLPDDRQLVVDSKVSLNAYVRYTASEDPAEREVELSNHVAAVRTHLRVLSEKRYQDLYQLRTLDFVFMFVPVEPAFTVAVAHDATLFNEAFERNIVIVGPSTLLATLRTVAGIWRVERQNRHALEIARQAGLLYDKFVGFAADLDDVGRRLDAAQQGYHDARRKLDQGRGNLVAGVEKLRLLGARAAKRLPAERVEEALASDGASGGVLPEAEMETEV